MSKVYACLIGDWVCLNDDPSCTIDGRTPYIWWEEGAEIYAPFKRSHENTLYELNYLNIVYQGKNYRVNPIHIQIVSE